MAYYNRSAGVVVDLTAAPGGAGGPEDLITGVEGVEGSAYDDVLRGGPAGERLEGGGGDDHVDGRGGDDSLNGGGGDDDVEGGEGDDGINGGGGRDRLQGGPGDDGIYHPSNEERRSRGVSCGPGDDFVGSLPAGDLLARDCERVELRSFITAFPRTIDGHPRFDVTRRSENPVSCRVRVEIHTMGGRLLARGAKRTVNRAARVTAVLTATGRPALRGRATPLRVEVAFRRAGCRGAYGRAERFEVML